MIRSLWFAVCLGLASAGFAATAAAHPHVFIDSRSVLVMDDSGRLVAIRHEWAFDPAFSAYAIQGLDEDGDGTYTRAELAELAQINVESLSEYDFFTFLDHGGNSVAFTEPDDQWLEHDGNQLTLRYTLRLAEPLALDGETATLQIFDPTIFVAFFLDRDQAAVAENDGGACTVEHVTEGENQLDATTDFSDDFLAAIEQLDQFAAEFAEEIRLTCA